MTIIKNKDIVKEMEQSFLDYSMSVIVARALPDVRDGLKPVHRRIIYGMQQLPCLPNGPYKKSARITGDVMGKYHPHGNSSIYDAMVRMAQDFSTRYPLVDGHGNFGSMDGDGAAAERYTEARMSKLSLKMVEDLNKDTVDFVPTYDEDNIEPVVLPSRIPNLLANGSMGIAVGMATNIPPHNLTELLNGTIALIDNPDIDIDGLMEHIKGPDFPTAAIILGNSGIKKAYETGRGSIAVRAKCEIEKKANGKASIIVTEVPYLTNKATLQTRIAELVRDKVLDGITEIRDESSSRTGIRIVIELRRDVNENVLLNNLYKHSGLQTTFSCNMLALVDGVPKLLNLKEMLSHYVNHQKDVLVRRSRFELLKHEKRVHILEGFKIALDYLDEIIKIIRNAESDVDAKSELMLRFKLTDIQAEAILEMKLRRLTGLEKAKILDELAELIKQIAYLNELLESDSMQLGVVKEELTEVRDKYGDERRTYIDMTAISYIEDESLIPVEDIIITLTSKGYIKRLPIDTYKTQNRGGVGVKGMSTNEEDTVENMIYSLTHDYILFFTNKGRVYRIKGYEIPEFSRQSKGLPIVNLLSLDADEYVKTVLKTNENDGEKYFVFATENGIVKRTKVSEFDNIRVNGKNAITLKDDDHLISVQVTDGSSMVVLATSDGRMCKCEENEIRVMGRSAAGVRGINVDGSKCINLEVANEDSQIFVISENGYGKRTNISEYRLTHRGSKGVKTINQTEKTGMMISFKVINGDEDVVIMTNNGMIIRIDLSTISLMSRVTQGVRLINLKDGQSVSTVSILEKSDETEENFEVTTENAAELVEENNNTANIENQIIDENE